MRRPSFLTLVLVVGLLATATGGALALTGQFPGSGGKGPARSAAKKQYPSPCKQLKRENREEEREQRRENRAEEKAAPKGSRKQVRRENREEEREQRRENRQEEKECRS